MICSHVHRATFMLLILLKVLVKVTHWLMIIGLVLKDDFYTTYLARGISESYSLVDESLGLML